MPQATLRTSSALTNMTWQVFSVPLSLGDRGFDHAYFNARCRPRPVEASFDFATGVELRAGHCHGRRAAAGRSDRSRHQPYTRAGVKGRKEWPRRYGFVVRATATVSHHGFGLYRDRGRRPNPNRRSWMALTVPGASLATDQPRRREMVGLVADRRHRDNGWPPRGPSLLGGCAHSATASPQAIPSSSSQFCANGEQWPPPLRSGGAQYNYSHDRKHDHGW